jgi:RNA polymerase sigma-70 factor (ECF subfamily)
LAAHATQLCTLARQLAGHGDADDFVQDVLVAALSEPQPPRSPGPWLRQVLRNRIRGSVRRARRRDELASFLPELEPRAALDDDSANAELIAAMHEVLAGLEEPFRTVLRERFFGERSTIEIARQLGCPHGTVRWRLHEGLRRMKQELDQRFGRRDRWLGAMVVLGGGPRLELAAPAQGAPVFKASIPQTLGFAALTCAAAVACTFAALETPNEPSTTRTSEPAAVASRDDDAPPQASHAAAPSSAPEGAPTRSRTLATRTAKAAAAGTNTKASPEDDRPTMTVLEYRRCGEEAAAEYNATDGPGGGELLLEAARCFEGAGLVGLAIHANRTLIARHPEYAEQAADENQRLYWLILDAELALETPVGRQCVEPLHEDDTSASDYVEAADCLYTAGLVAAALHHRELARERPGTFDAEANESKIAELGEALARVEQIASRPDDESPR